MPFKRLNFPLQPSPEEPVMVPKPAPSKLGVIQTTSALMGDYRSSTIWYALMERSWSEAYAKLKETVSNDLHADTSQLDALIPCIIDLKEARTNREEQVVRRVYKRFSMIYAGLIDRLVRYNPESRPFAYDWLKQELINWRPFYRPYVCENFRKPKAAEK